MHIVYLALGSNIGEREEYLIDGLRSLSAHPMVHIKDVSSIYETEPVGYVEQPQFLNMVVSIQTRLSPRELLSVTQEIENKSGRIRGRRWGPRTLDLDILMFDDENIETESLIIPHPRMKERNFVMVPLLEIAAKVIETHLKSCDINIDREGIIVWRDRQQISLK